MRQPSPPTSRPNGPDGGRRKPSICVAASRPSIITTAHAVQRAGPGVTEARAGRALSRTARRAGGSVNRGRLSPWASCDPRALSRRRRPAPRRYDATRIYVTAGHVISPCLDFVQQQWLRSKQITIKFRKMNFLRVNSEWIDCTGGSPHFLELISAAEIPLTSTLFGID